MKPTTSNMLTESFLREKYNSCQKELEILKDQIVLDLKENLESIDYIDQVYGRVKQKKGFVKKYFKDPEKYKVPIRDIEDLIGIRILVLFKSTSKVVSERISTSVFPSLENEYRREKDPRAFGYEGYQSLHAIPDSYTDGWGNAERPRYFELQVRTLFQHSFIEPQHEIDYKRGIGFSEQEEIDYSRSFAWIAASSWGADEILEKQFEFYKSRISGK